MTDPRTHRRLAAILAADVVGYSRLMGVDEAGTLAALRLRWREVLTPAVARHRGRVVKVMGDGVLVEFGSAVDAVECAVAVQEGFGAANEGQPADRNIILRIGINLGDVMVEGSDLYGDGVNIAARLEGLAEPGGICVSAKVWGEVQGKVAASFAPMGPQELKNVASPVEAYRVIAGVAPESPPAPVATPDTRLSVAVLPFAAMGGDAADQHLTDGLTEDIITELSRVPFLHVASRSAAFRFRGPGADIAAAARTLGVRFVIEGSLRRMGARIRISAQLIDSTTGVHLWAERYDRPAEDIFDTQDEVVRGIATTAASRLQIAGAEIARGKPESQRSVQDLILQAEEATWADPNSRSHGIVFARQALDLDPTAARAHSVLAFLVHLDWLDDFEAPDSLLDAAFDHARNAVALAPGDYYSHLAMVIVCTYRGAFDLAEAHLERARTLNPNRPGVLSAAAHLAVYLGRPAEAQELLDAACRLDATFAPSWYWSSVMLNRYVARDDAGAISAFRSQTSPRPLTHALAAAAFANLGDEAATRAQVAATLALFPQFTITASTTRDPFRHEADRDHYRNGMLRAGLPE